VSDCSAPSTDVSCTRVAYAQSLSSYVLSPLHAMGTLCGIVNDCTEAMVPLSRRCVDLLMLRHSTRALERSLANAACWATSFTWCMIILYCSCCTVTWEDKNTWSTCAMIIMLCSWCVPAHHSKAWPSDYAAKSNGNANNVPWLQAACSESSRIWCTACALDA